MRGRVLIFSAPSGAGKSTVVGHLLNKFPELEFSVSATSREKRGKERDGVDYYFLTGEQFTSKASNGEFVEWEEVYQGACYGTLRSEVERIWAKGNVVVFDVDVVGGVNLKSLFVDNSLSVFIQPPSIEELRSRLVIRATDSPEAIDRRIGKAVHELTYADKFDAVLINDNLSEALCRAEAIVSAFIRK